jgi:pimeloyl-ACP methyl ester carboxylesterase
MGRFKSMIRNGIRRGTRLAAGALLAVLAGPRAQAVTDLQHQAQIAGSGRDTVIFEAGVGDTMLIWQNIQPQIARHCARTFVYTRAGYLGSDPPSPGAERDAVAIVDELRDELQRRHVGPPYVLVGHSLGGLYMQYFARNYPAEVSGVVLIDSTHWTQGLTVDPTANTPYQSRRAVTLFIPWIMRRELADSAAAGKEVSTSPPPKSMPVIVLSSTKLMPGETQEQRDAAVSLQNEIAASFPGSRHDFVENSGHYIQRDQPGIVIDAIRAAAGCN